MAELGLAEAYRRHGPGVFRRARHILGVDADAHEVVQDVFLSLHERPGQYAGKSSLTTFLYSATTHACLNRVRNRKNRERLELQRFDSLDGDHVDQRLTPEQASMLRRALETMPDQLAQVAIYHLIDGLTHQEIAELLDCSRRHVGDLLERLKAWAQAEEAS